MPRRFFTSDHRVGDTPSQRRQPLWGAAGFFLVLFLVSRVAAAGQDVPGFASPQGDNQTSANGTAGHGAAVPGQSQATSGNGDLSGDAPNLSPSGALSADQIVAILEQDPDLLMELKSQLADRLQQQGVQIDATDITDQMVYSQIASNATLRAGISQMLQERGYTSDAGGGPAASATGEGSSLDSGSPLSLLTPDASMQASQALSPSGQGVRRGAAPAELPPGMRSGSLRPGAAANPRGQEKGNASTDLPSVLHRPTPLNLQSMRDLYAQIPDDSKRLERFGSAVFVNRSLSPTSRQVSGLSTPLDVPLGPDYIVGSGDQLTIELWGGATQTIIRRVDRDGRVFLPEAGALQVAGLSLDKVQSSIADALKPQFRNAQIVVTVSGLRSVRVYVVGDVQRPGGYDISSLATPMSALYAAGGPTAVGSLRILRHYRGEQLVEDIDLYDFLLHGIRGQTVRFESGDTLLVPPAGPQVAVSGAVKREAIYELKPGDTMLSAVIDDAGGFTASASLSHIRIERIDANHQRVTVTLPDAAGQPANAGQDAIAHFAVHDGDRIRVEPILSYSERAVYLAGHVVRPGRLPYSDGMRLSDVIRSYQDLLPEPAGRGEIVRLVPPDLHAETIDFDVPEVLIGNSNIDL